MQKKLPFAGFFPGASSKPAGRDTVKYKKGVFQHAQSNVN